MGNYNHSQLEELRMTPQELWERKVGHIRNNPWGIETPLGHAYSIILEELVLEGIVECEPNPKEFLDFIKNHLEKMGDFYRATDKDVNLMARCWYPAHIEPIILYMKKLYCYVDESGQDTKGGFFVVSIVVLEKERDLILRE